MKTILVVGGTGAQGAAVIRTLVSSFNYRVLLFTRNTQSGHSRTLIELGNVEGITNNADHGYDLDAFEAAARRADGVFINTDGFALGEQAETYWGMRLFESSVKCNVKHIVYSGLDNNYRNSGYDPALYAGHYQGKARVQDFIKSQPPSDTLWTIVRSGPYIEMLSEALLPSVSAGGEYSFNLPLASGAAPLIHLDDFGRYIAWVFTHPRESSSLDFGIATAHITGQAIADAFTATTGKPAVYNDIPAAAWTSAAFKGLPDGHDTYVGHNAAVGPASLNQTYKENFASFWNLYKASAGNKGLIQRDYALLDRILPDRVRSVREWMEKTEYDGSPKRLLKGASRPGWNGAKE